MAFIWISLITNDVENILICVFPIHISPLVMGLFKPLPIKKNKLFPYHWALRVLHVFWV